MNKNHPWHDIAIGENSPEYVNAIIEIPKGSRAKYEIDKPSGLLKLDRVIYSSMCYPSNYGFIPQSYCGDGDPLDILVLSQIDFVPMCIVSAKVIGVMRMNDNNESDDKIIAVSAGDPSVNHINDIDELAPHFILELKNFFEDYKKLEGKEVAIGEFMNKKKALEIIQDSFVLYDKEIRPSR
jgi:inorganic pyrophosphatase